MLEQITLKFLQLFEQQAVRIAGIFRQGIVPGELTETPQLKTRRRMLVFHQGDRLTEGRPTLNSWKKITLLLIKMLQHLLEKTIYLFCEQYQLRVLLTMDTGDLEDKRFDHWRALPDIAVMHINDIIGQKGRIPFSAFRHSRNQFPAG